jgi:hypothetical protein
MRLPLLAICVVVVALTIIVGLSGASPPAPLVVDADACPEPTPPPGPTPVPHTIGYCHGQTPSSDGLRGFFETPAQRLDVVVSQNPGGCPVPTVTSDRTDGPDFSFEVTVTWGAPCVYSGRLVELSFACAQEPSGAAEPCLPSGGCADWTLAGQPQGSPCPTPDCGGVPCCNGLPCPTPTHTPSATPSSGIPVAPGTPGDYDCDNVITTSDAGRLLAELAGTPYLPLGRPCSIPTGISPQNLGDPTCDGIVDTRDVLAILQIVAELRMPGYCS